MKVEEIMEQARDTITVKRVFGEPYVKNGTTIIPVASVMGGGGAGEGGGPMPMPGAEGEAGATPVMATGMGGGFGVRATPAGAYVIHGDEVVWQPAIDVTRIEVMNRAIAIVGILVFGSILRALLRR